MAGIATFLAIGAVSLATVCIRTGVAGRPLLAVMVVAGLAVTVVAAGGRIGGQVRAVLLLVLLLGLAALTVWQVRTAATPFADRLLLVGAVLASCAAALLGVLHGIRRPSDPTNRVLLTTSLAVPLFLAELALGVWRPIIGTGGRWEGSTVPDSVLGERYAPYSELASYYPTNPTGYFEVDSGESRTWQLATHAGAARLAVTPRDSVLLSLVVDSVPDDIPAAIQVNHPGLHIVAGRRYRLTLRGRAEPARTIHVAVSRAEAPWDGLGLYEATELQPGWQMLASEFVATEGSDTARVHFDIAAPAGELWLDDIVLTDLASGERVQVALVPRYRVVYRFNGLGCRGPDYAIPKPEGTIRILALGDSYMLGAGVHEQDALPARLDSLLARRSDGLRYEVINCGVSGYGTREERLFYERHARRYQPDIVLLALVFNDDLSWAEELRRGYHRERGRLASLSMAWDLVQRARQRRPPPEFDGVLAEALSLGRAARADGAELVAVAFRNHAFDLPHAGAPWRALLAGIEPGLRRGDVPFADLGPILLGGASQEALLVHPVDGHPSARAHELAAEAVLELLDRRRLLPLSAGRFSDTGDAGVARP